MVQEKAILIDGLNIMYRLFFGGSPRVFHPENNRPIEAFFLFTKMLITLKNSQPKYISVVMDGINNISNKQKDCSTYKGNRDAMPEDLVYQVGLAKDIVKLLGCNLVEIANVEADDVIAYLTKKMSPKNHVTIYTNDKDLMQLVSSNVILKRRSGPKFEDFTEEAVKDKMGCYPNRIWDLLSIAGDSSDNIRGIHGIGQKGALEIINTFPTVEEAFANKHLLSKRVAGKMSDEALDAFYLAKNLTNLFSSEFNIPLLTVETQKASSSTFLFLKGLGLTRVLDSMKSDSFKVSDTQKQHYPIEKFSKKHINALHDSEITLLYELLGTHPQKTFVNIFIYTEKLLSTYIHVPKTDQMYDTLLKIIELPKSINIFNVKDFLHASNSAGIEIAIKFSKKFYDVSIAHYLLQPSASSFSVQAIASTCCTVTEFALPKPEQLQKIINKTKQNIQYYDMQNIINEIDTPFSWLLFEMEKNGIYFNKVELDELKTKLLNEVKNLEYEIFKKAGQTFNIASTKALNEILFNILKLPVTRKTTSAFSTDAKALSSIKDTTGIVKLILEWRNHKKNISTYIDGIVNSINPTTKRVHPEFNLFGTKTGRISCKNPNLQNLPKNQKGSIRSAMQPQCPFKKLISCDYNQMEIRVLAMLSNDQKLLSSFLEKKDIHTKTAAIIFMKKENKVTSKERTSAKTINFGIMYGQQANSLALDLKITKEEAQRLIDGYFKALPQVRDFINRSHLIAKEKGYSSTYFNRKRFIPEISDKNFAVHSFGERVSVNSPIQGTAADILKLKMIDLYKTLHPFKEEIKIILQVHDEIVLESVLHTNKFTPTISSILTNNIGLSVPLEIKITVQKQWS